MHGMEFFHVIGGYIADSWEMMIGRPGGPMALRFVLQPVMATLLAIRAGRRDARSGHTPYLWSFFEAGDTHDRRAIARSGWSDIRKVFLIAIALDVAYELVVYRWVYPIQAIIIAAVLALLPYFVFRGLVTRLAASRGRQP